MERKRKLGVIADDFTGASDAASFLKKGGSDTILLTSLNGVELSQSDAIVVALKSRSVQPFEAISMTSEALKFLLKNGCNQIYFKYCSTFDSTPQGNIGVVLDYLLDYFKEQYSILCPSLPINNRIVIDGMLYVNGVRLDESPMKNHPLNPMWDASIPKLMKNQSRYPTFVVNDPIRLEEIQKSHSKFYIVPDYQTDEDGQKIFNLYGHLPLLSGGSALLEFLGPHELSKPVENSVQIKKSIILCGSCSKATKKQIDIYKSSGKMTYAVDSKKLLDKRLTSEDVFRFVLSQNETVLVYSSAIDDIEPSSNNPTFFEESQLIEKTMADIAKLAVENGFNNIVVAGGETSGAVTLKLGYTSFIIGDSVDPGIPILYPIENENLRLLLKSGNFGDDNFFLKAIGADNIENKR